MPFVKGHKVGRPKGAVNESTRLIRDAFVKVFRERGGHKGLAAWAESNPDEFYKLTVKLCPKEVEVSGPDGGPIQATIEVEFIGPAAKNKS